MTVEEQEQVQKLIAARTNLLSRQVKLQQETLSRQEEQIFTLREEISSRNDEINSLNKKIISLNDEIIDRREEINSLTGKIRVLNLELESRNREITNLQARLKDSNDENAKLADYIQSRPAVEPEVHEQEVKPAPVKRKSDSYLVSLLRQHFGFESFKPGQEEIINALLSGRDVFCSMPDGYGKSICYRLPALLMPGLTLVITPFEANFEVDSHSACLNSSLSSTQKRELMRKIKNGACKILYSSLTQLNESSIMNFLRGIEISLVAIRIDIKSAENIKSCREFIETMKLNRVPVAVFAGVTSPELRGELMRDLRLPLRVITGFDIQNLSFKVIKTEDKDSALNEILNEKSTKQGVILSQNLEDAIKFAGKNAIILSDLKQIENEIGDKKFIVSLDFSGTLANYADSISTAMRTNAEIECIVLASRNDLKHSDGAFIMFTNIDDPAKFLFSYLGTTETQTQSNAVQEVPELNQEDFSDFDFASANEAQKEAITSSNGPVLIIAGPGTGKTFTIIQRTIFLIQKRKVKPENILIATFTNKAAREIVSRMNDEFSIRKISADLGGLYIGTFHSLCERILRDYVQYSRFKKDFRILDGFSHRYLLMRKIDNFKDVSFLSDSGKWVQAGELCNYMNVLSEELADPERLSSDNDEDIASLGRAMKIHDSILIEANALSFSQLLVETYKLLRDNPEILGDLQNKIKYVMADEYQDTNYIQEQILFLISGQSKNICVVGDDDQSLYRFRGATVRNILEFPNKFARNECKIIRLMLNYRSDPDILKFFTNWINNTSRFFQWENFRHEKNLEAFLPEQASKTVYRLAGVNDSAEWHEKIFALIKSLKDSGKITDYNQIAFLFRSVRSERVQNLAQFLENHNINVYSPRSDMFFKRGEIHFALGCLISMFPKYLQALDSGEFNYHNYEPSYIAYYKNCLKTVARFIDKPGYSELKQWLMKKREYHGKLKGNANYNYSDLLYNLFAFMPFNKALDTEISADLKSLRPARNLSLLMEVIKDFERTSGINNLNSKFLNYHTVGLFNIYLRFLIDGGVNEYEDEDASTPSGNVAFMTIHQAKGREFPIVFVDSLWSIPGEANELEDDLISRVSAKYFNRPPYEPLDKIKFFDFWRLFYVAFSRAKSLLILTCKEDSKTPSQYFEDSYNALDDADESMNLSEINILESSNSSIKPSYSFTSDILLYESCPVKYKFYCELEFSPKLSKSELIGLLVHSVIDDIHRTVINGHEEIINENIISEWIEQDYASISKNGHAYLSKADREIALSHVIRYMILRGNNWSDILQSETELTLIREDFIMKGIADLICSNDGILEIVDFKTGTKPNLNINRDKARLENHKRQLNIYAYILANTTGHKAENLRLYYTSDLSTSPDIVFNYDESEAEAIINGFDEIVRQIQSKKFNLKTNNPENCRECEFRFYCNRDEVI